MSEGKQQAMPAASQQLLPNSDLGALATYHAMPVVWEKWVLVTSRHTVSSMLLFSWPEATVLLPASPKHTPCRRSQAGTLVSCMYCTCCVLPLYLCRPSAPTNRPTFGHGHPSIHPAAAVAALQALPFARCPSLPPKIPCSLPHRQAHQGADGVAHQHRGRLPHKLCHEVRHQRCPGLNGVLLQWLVRVAKAQQVDGIHLWCTGGQRCMATS